MKDVRIEGEGGVENFPIMWTNSYDRLPELGTRKREEICGCPLHGWSLIIFATCTVSGPVEANS